jgi:hypothetical protein
MSGLARKIFVGQLSMMMSRISELRSSSSDCVESPLPLRAVFCAENHRRVLLATGLQCLDDVALDDRVLQEQPSLVNEVRLEDVADLRVADDRVRASRGNILIEEFGAREQVSALKAGGLRDATAGG